MVEDLKYLADYADVMKGVADADNVFAVALERIEVCRKERWRSLDLNDLRLTHLPPEIGQLSAMNELHLDGNHLTTLPPEIGRLTSLTELHLSSNQLTTLPPEIGRLTSLTKLYLFNNQLTTLPPEIGRLEALTKLYLSNNQLTTLPAGIGHLTALRKLGLQSNRLAALPPEISSLTALEACYLHHNPGLGLPTEVLGPSWFEITSGGATKPKPPKEIFEYYFRIHPPASVEGAEFAGQLLLEARVIVVGDGGAGKTSLVRALLHGESARESEETTRKVVVEDWPDLELAQPRTQETHPVSVHLWDFGGQEPMHAAHPYFFTSRTLYLVVATAREAGVEERIAYWLKMIELHGKGARALVAVNQVDQHPMDIAQRELCAAHPESLHADPARAFFATSCKGRMKGVASLRKALKRELQAMEQIWAYLPVEWMTVKKQLEEQRGNEEDTLTFDQWDGFCAEADMPLEERSRALQLFRDLGTVVSFPDDDHLSHLGVLNPSWVTGGIYPLLTSKELAAAGGLLERQQMGSLLNDAKGYPKHRHAWLIELMKKFELLFENEGRLLMPARLPKDAPAWALEPIWTAPDALQLQVRFTLLPESVISKFITRWHDQAWRESSWWRHGIAVTDVTRKCAALVRAHLGDPGRIELKVRGPKVARQGFVAVLREEFRRLCLKLEGELWLILEGVHAERYDDLLLLVHEAKEYRIKRVVGTRPREFDLVQALDLIEPEERQQQMVAQIIQVGRDAVGNAFGEQSRVTNQGR